MRRSQSVPSAAVGALVQPREQLQFPSFSVWQARQLWTRDLLFGLVLAAILLLYYNKTVPKLCTEGPLSCPAQQQDSKHQQLLWRIVCGGPPAVVSAPARIMHSTHQQLNATAAGTQQLAVELGMTASGSHKPPVVYQAARLAAAAAVKLSRPLVVLLQALVTFYGVCLISCDPFHLVMPPLRSALLLLLLLPVPLPRPQALWRSARAAAGSRTGSGRAQSQQQRQRSSSYSIVSQGGDSCCSSSSSSMPASCKGFSSSSSMPASCKDISGSSSGSDGWVGWYHPSIWWQQPQLRQAVIAAQRVVPLLAAAVAAGAPHSSLYFKYTMQLSLWSSVGKYAYQGWMQYMLVLPLPLHVATSLAEWLLVYSTALRLDAAYSGIATAAAAAAGGFDTAVPSSGFRLLPAQLLLSLLCVVLLPTLGVARLQQQQRAAYERIKAAHGREPRQQQEQQEQQQKGATAGKAALDYKEAPVKGSVAPAQPQQQGASTRSAFSAASLSSSSRAAEITAANVQLQQQGCGGPQEEAKAIKRPQQQQQQREVVQRQDGACGEAHQSRRQERQPFLDDSSYDSSYILKSKGRSSSNTSSREPSPEKTLAGWLAETLQQHQQQLGTAGSSSSSSSGSSSDLGPARSASVPLLLRDGCGALRRCDSAQGSLALKDDMLPAIPSGALVSTASDLDNFTAATSAAPSTNAKTTSLISTAAEVGDSSTAAAAPKVAAAAVQPAARSDSAGSAAAAAAAAATSSSGRRGKQERRTGPRRDSAAEQFLADIESSMNVTAAAAPGGLGLSSGGSGSQLHGLLPSISSLLGEEGAAAVFLAAAAAAAPAEPCCAGGAMPFYTSMAQALPASIKVHTAHSNVASLAPTLTSCLASGLAGLGSNSSPLQMAAACFPGCVQLLANVFAVRPDGAEDSPGSGGGSRGGGGDGGCGVMKSGGRDSKGVVSCAVANGGTKPDGGSAAAAAILSNVCGELLALGEGVPDVDVALGAAAASTKGTAAAQAVVGTSSSASDSPGFPAVSLQCMQPACLVAGQPQQTLTLQLAVQARQEAAAEGGASCRLVAFQDGAAVVDQTVTLQGSSVSVDLPELPLGVLHVALLPCSPADDGSSSSSSAPAVSEAGDALLLLAPLLVLPAAAAQELQQQAQLAAAEDGDEIASLAALYSGTVAPLTIDVAYVLSACRDASNWPTGAAAAAGPLPEGVKAVLQQLLSHLAACGMWETMRLLVECATAAAAAAAAAGKGFTADGAVTCSRSLVAAAAATAASRTRSSNGSGGGAPEVGSCSRSSSGPLKPAAAAAGAGKEAQLPSSQLPSAASSLATGIVVPATSLLWGFDSPQLEDSYQAAAYSSSRAMDIATLVYASVFGVSIYYARGGSSRLQLQQQQQTSPGLLLRSQVFSALVCVIGPIVILMQRWFVSRKLQLLQQQQQQQQQHDVVLAKAKRFRASPDSDGAESASRSSSDSSSRCAVLAQAELLAAAHVKQRLLLSWQVLVLAWASVMVAGGCGLLLLPAMAIKQWQGVGWAENIGCIVAFALKGWTLQVPVRWFLLLQATDVLINVLGSLKYGLPLLWLVARYSVCAVLPFAIFALQQLQGRLRFCMRHGVRVTGRLLPVLSWE